MLSVEVDFAIFILLQGGSSESIQQAINELDSRRVHGLQRVFVRAASVYSKGGAGSDTPLGTLPGGGGADVETETACSSALASLLSQGVISEQEEDIYEICRLAWEHANVGIPLQSAYKELEDARIIHEYERKLVALDGMIRSKDFLGGANVIKSMQGHIDGMDVGVLDRLNAKAEEYQSVMKSEVVSLIRFKTFVPYVGEEDVSRLEDVWEAGKLYGMLEDLMEAVACHIHEHSLLPVIKRYANSDDASLHGMDERKTVPGYREKVLYKIFKTTCEALLFGDSELVAVLGCHLWSKFAVEYNQAAFAHVARDEEMNRDDYYYSQMLKKLSFGRKLEEKAGKLGFIPCDGQGPIATACSEHLKSLLRGRQAEILSMSRDALVVSFQSQSLVRFEKGDSILPSFSQKRDGGSLDLKDLLEKESSNKLFSACAYDEMQFVYPLAVLEEPLVVLEGFVTVVQLLTSRLAVMVKMRNLEAVNAAYGTLHLVAHLVEKLYDVAAESEQNIPYIACIQYMSCMYLFRSFILLPVALDISGYWDSSKLVEKSASKMRCFADLFFDSMLNSQRKEMQQDVESLCCWGGSLDAQKIISKKKSVQRIRNTFQRLGAALHADVPGHICIKVISTLCSTLFSSILSSILGLTDISEELSVQIPMILEELLPKNGDDGVLGCAVTGMQMKDIKQASEVRSQLKSLVWEGAKLQELCILLSISSREIADKWECGQLRDGNFTQEEVLHLICALFEDNPFRQESEQRILMIQ